MQRTEVYINGTSIDLDSFAYDISLSISDINDISKRNSGKTIIIKVPATTTNRKVFEHFDSNVATQSNTSITGKIVSGGFEAEGKVFLFESTNINETIYYRFQIVFDNANWIDAIGEALVSELDFSEYDHVYNEANIINSWVDGNFYVYPLIDYGNTSSSPNVPINAMRPSFRIKDIVDKIFLNSKYNINSEFLESDYFKKLYLLDVSNFKRQISNDDYLFKVGLSAQQNVNHLTKFNPILFDTISGWAGYNGGEVSEFFDNGKDACYFNVRTDRFRSRAGALSPDVQDVRSIRNQAQAMGYRRFRRKKTPSIGK